MRSRCGRFIGLTGSREALEKVAFEAAGRVVELWPGSSWAQQAEEMRRRQIDRLVAEAERSLEAEPPEQGRNDAAILAREMNLVGVVGVRNATRLLSTGDLVRLCEDGTVQLEERAPLGADAS